ncbi:MAG: hypothetical protein COV29_00260 [Candidatus Yanofskybacteria bacterium CG10_big_fil_rev_8_21_14_0_10_36_16]|uniref:Recombinase family protein n=1 Tax=Candidatus Yanofskybacteria bacterium CG10_big_fil_rev_8_21_14_0_10_36_16 TaxID=1975096 RepID=A0A2J0Q8X2_9BACT|nr:MAG: hypothetical protein COV29_00260 [Candidatus Yanofskybacteria bacterium CG10_big_fil_rev_8_21_14_0_10_36_16]
MEKTKRLAALYGRVSTSNQEDQKTIENQVDALNELANKNDFTIVQEYKDDGWSGDILARPALDQLRQDAKSKIWDTLLIYDPDRLARRYSYQELIMDELKEAGVEVIFITVSAPKNPEDKILHGVRGLFAEYERVRITERFRLGKLRKVKNGHVLTTEAPYGYNYIRGDRERQIHGYYKINPEEAEVVKKIFQWIGDEKLNIRAVVRKLKEVGIKPRKAKRGVWATSTISTMLKNGAYIGEAHWGSSYAVVPENPIKKEKYKKMKKSSRRIKPKEDWIASKIPVPAIITKELFAKVQKQLKTNSSLCPRNKKYTYLLGGKIHCVCGKTRSGVGPQRGKHLYYRCNDRIYSFPIPPTCKEQAINARIADELVWNKIANLMSSPELLKNQAEKWSDSRKVGARSHIGDIETTEKEILKLKAQEDRYNKAYGAGVFDINQLKEYVAPVRERIELLKSQIVKIKQEENQSQDNALPSLDEIRSFTKVTRNALFNLNFEMKRATILNVIDKIIGTQKQLKVYGQVPITQNYVTYKTSYRYSRVAQCWKINII